MVKLTLGTTEYDSVTTVAAADVFLAGDVMRATAWALRNDDTKARGLISATRMLLALPWCEGPLDLDAVPPLVAEVGAMLAADLLAKPKLFADASGNSNIKSAKAGSAQIEFFSPVVGGPPIPMTLWRMLLNADLVCLSVAGPVVNDGAIVTGISDGCRPLGGRFNWDWPVAARDYD